jgi:hypothetical protein
MTETQLLSNSQPHHPPHWLTVWLNEWLVQVQVQVQVILRPRSVGQFVLMSSPLWSRWPDFSYLCLTVTFFLLHVGPPLWREDGSVTCSEITHRLESRRKHNHKLLSNLSFHPTWRARSPYLYPPGTGWLSYTPEHWVPFCRFLRLSGYGGNIIARHHKVKAKFILRPTVSRPVHLGVRHPSGTRDQFFPLSLIIFRQFRVCWCGAPSLTRSRVCTFQFFSGIDSAAFLRSESHGTHEHSLLSLFFRLPQPGELGSCIYLPQEQGSHSANFSYPNTSARTAQETPFFFVV